MKTIAVLFIAASMLMCRTHAGKADTGDTTRTLGFDGLQRSYIVHVPDSCDRSKPAPVVLVLHGGGSNAKQWIPFCGMNETADKYGFIAVYPNGTGHVTEGHEIFGWNGGPHRPGGEKPHLNKIDDVGFIRALIADLGNQTRIDRKRIFCTGMSMGAIMVYRLASELSGQIAAIAPIAGSMGTETCHPARPVSILHFHGTDDPAVPMAGGKGKLDPSGAVYLSVDHAINRWVEANGCESKPIVEPLPDLADDGTTATRKTYRGGKENSEIVLIAIRNGGHTWPGRDFGPELEILGKSSRDFSANELMWEFFLKHPIP